MQNNSLGINIGISLFVFGLMYFYTEINFASSLGVVLFVFFVSKFFFDLGKKIEIRDIMIILASLQWIIGPILAYTFNPDDPIFYMSVDEKTYMDFVIPANYAFAIGLYLPIFRVNRNDDFILQSLKEIVNKYPNLDLIFIIGGSFLHLISGFFPAFLAFFAYLLGNFRFVGLYFLLIRDRPYKWFIFTAVIISFITLHFEHAMFHDLLLWLGFMLIIIAYIYKISIAKKTIIFIASIVFIVSIQTVKGDFRTMSMEDRTIETFYDLASQNFNAEFITSDVFVLYNINRINQGWIIARIMYNMPMFEPFADGETIWRAIKASFIPRFLDPDIKTNVGYSQYFKRFTGQALASGTSMDISILGEAYANYGTSGGVLTMLLLGIAYNFIFNQIIKKSYSYPSLFFMIPIMFLQVIKAETDFTSTFNFLVKGSMVVVGVIVGLRNMFGLKI